MLRTRFLTTTSSVEALRMVWGQCFACKGSGTVGYGLPCRVCGGSGR